MTQIEFFGKLHFLTEEAIQSDPDSELLEEVARDEGEVLICITSDLIRMTRQLYKYAKYLDPSLEEEISALLMDSAMCVWQAHRVIEDEFFETEENHSPGEED